jgi:nucleotide-binding universal stress UspA family protein
MNLPKKILVATDFNELAAAALRVAADLAQRTGGSVVLLYADRFEPPAEFTSPQLPRIAKVIDASRRHAKEELERCAARAIPAGIEHQNMVVESLPVPAITEYADTHDIDLIAMGTHGRGSIQRILLGSVAEEVLRRTTVPLLTVHDPSRVRPIQRVACTSGAKDYAIALAREIGAGLRVIGAEDAIAGCDCDLLVIDEALHGSHQVIRHAHVPVITLPHGNKKLTTDEPKETHELQR